LLHSPPSRTHTLSLHDALPISGAGAASGAWFGLFFGIILFLFSDNPGAIAFVGAALLIGAGFGMIFGIVSYAMNRSRRDFTSTRSEEHTSELQSRENLVCRLLL